MEWYTFGLDRVLIFLLAVASALVIILTIMFKKSVVERGPNIYIGRN